MSGKFRIAATVWIAFLTGVVAFLIQAAGWGEAVRYERLLVQQGEIWRILTGHLAHLGWAHLWMNLGGIVAVALLFRGCLTASTWLMVSVLSAIAIGAGLYFLDPEVAWYVGLSGILHGLLVAGALASIRHAPLLGGGLLVLLLSKLVWEQLVGPLPGSEAAAGGTVVVQAHLYGALGGLVACAVLAAVKRISRITGP